MSRLRRFLHLERVRPEVPDGEAGVSSRARFGGVDAPTATATPTPTPTPTPTATRFRRPDLRAPDVAVAEPGAQPFVRCFRCETDASVYASRCSTCGEPLDTPAQRAFNEKLWAERRRVAEEEERAVADARAERERAEAEAARARRELGETLARETARRERQRLDAEASRDGWGGWGGRWGEDDGGARSPGLRLLMLIRDPRWRLGVALGALALLVGLVAWAVAGGGGQLAVYLVAIAVALLFGGRRRRRWWR